MKMILTDFLWAGQDTSAHHGINFQTLALNKKEGGVRLISICAMSAGQHPLHRLLLQSCIWVLSVHKLGVADNSWVFNKCKTVLNVGSAIWKVL